MSEARRVLAWRVLALLGLWSAVVPFLATALGLDLEVSTSVEIVDHVLPGLAVTPCAAGGLAETRLGLRPATTTFTLPAICILAGVWITVSHAPLLVDAAEGTEPWGTSILHLVSGPAVAIVAFALFADSYRQEARRTAQP